MNQFISELIHKIVWVENLMVVFVVVILFCGKKLHTQPCTDLGEKFMLDPSIATKNNDSDLCALLWVLSVLHRVGCTTSFLLADNDRDCEIRPSVLLADESLAIFNDSFLFWVIHISPGDMLC